MPVSVKDQGSWKAATLYVKHNGAWKPADCWARQGGVWKLVAVAEGTPSLILDFVNSASTAWPVLALDFLSLAFQVDEGDATVGGEPINLRAMG